MLAYFLKVNVAIVLFYAFYRLFFYKDTFFGWRRTALLCFFAISTAVPLLNIQTWITEQEPMVAMADLYATVVLPEFVIAPNAPTNWKSIILKYADIAYWGIVILLVLRFLGQLIGLIRLAYKCRITQMSGTKIHLLPKVAGPFSFFHWIFINPSSHTKEELDEILAHEQTHARQWHSIDVILSELACILCWFNPFVWLMKREIRTNLEYMADARVLQNGYDSKTYQYHLLGLSHNKPAATIYNSFNVLPLKKRIRMMNKKRTKDIGRTKYLAFLPLAAVLMIISNIETVARTTKVFTTEALEIIDAVIASRITEPLETSKSTAVIEEAKPDALNNEADAIYEVSEHAPEFIDGGMPGLIKYLSKNIQYSKEAYDKGVQGRILVQFIVEKDGSISNTEVIRGVHPLLDEEAIRVITAMPKWKPGMQGGKAVRVRFTVPIVFNIREKQPATEEKTVDAESNLTPTDGIFEVVEQNPQFPEGMDKLMEYISNNIQYPIEAQKAGIQGSVTVQFIVDKEGYVTKCKVLRSVDPLLDAEALRLTKAMPKWKPGKQRGKAVSVRFSIPIIFKLQ